jgi:serine protease
MDVGRRGYRDLAGLSVVATILGVKTVQSRITRSLRLNALALATAVVFCGPVLAAGQAPGRALMSGMKASDSYDRFIVQYRGSTALRANADARQHALDAAARGNGVSMSQMRRTATGADVIRAERKMSMAEAQAFMTRLAADPNVEYVEIDRLNKPLLTPNDPSYGQQWGYNDSDAGIRANEAWDVATGTGVVVAVLDTGITSHADLNANVLPGYDFIADTFVANDGNGRDSNAADPGDWILANECGGTHAAQSSSWHGTHVAGTVAAVTNNGVGVAGTAFNAKILPVRVLGKCGGYDSDIADAIIWSSGGTVSGVPANANPAEVINLSLGGSGACGATTQAAINTAVGNGTTLAIAAGNDNVNVSNASPANCSNVIAVASTTNTGQRSSFSNYGNLIDIAAPGSNIYSTLNSGTQGPGTANYASYSGTSMATPHVAGVIALVQSIANPVKTPAQMEALLKAQVRAFPVTPSQTIGPGILDAKKAVDAANGGGNTAPVASFTFSTSGLTATFTDGSTDPGGSIASRSWNFGDGTTSTATNPSKTYAAAGTYTVTLTVTDNGGLTNTTTRSVTVSSGGGGGTVLSNGVAVTGLTATTGNSLNYTMVVPAGATNLSFVTSGGTGDADMYVRFGSAPTDTVYDCRPYASGNAETCNIATAQAGTYHVRLKAYSTFSGVSLTGSYSTGGGGGGTQTYTNTTDYAINNNATVNSPIVVSGRSGNAPSNASVTVAIVHTYQGDLKVDLVAPDGTLYNIHNRTGGGTDNINKTVTLNLSSEALNGTWNLRVNDNANGDTGYINSWSVTF